MLKSLAIKIKKYFPSKFITRFTILISFIFLSSILLVTYTPLANWLAKPLSIPSRIEKADVIVVLSGGTYPNGALSYFTLEREIWGLKLYHEGYAPKIIFAGGKTQSEIPDAFFMEKFALDFGIPKQDIIKESYSRNTFENILNTTEIMEKQGFKTALLVTSPIHLKRAMMLTGKTGLHFLPASPPSFDHLRKVPIDRALLFYFTTREYFALTFSKFKGHF